MDLMKLNNLIVMMTVLTINQILSKHTDIILIGSTGDLAKKYLWNSFFKLYWKYHSQEQSFSFYGCGRSQKESAVSKLKNIINEGIICVEDDSEDENVHLCIIRKRKFPELVSYFQLKTDQDFQNLCKHLSDSHDKNGKRDIIFYLSIPPESCSSTAAKINKHCYTDNKNINFRIVFEKPFGYDLKSAIKLQEELSSYFKQDEMYRIDHYLGKSIVREILPFRKLNPDIEKLLNADHVDRIEVVLKETVDCKGRTSYYNKNGVIRDVLQNHLMEILILLTTELDNDDIKIPEHKLQLINNIENVSSILLGQYDDYQNQSEEELDGEIDEFVPTYAAARLSILSKRWAGVPIIFVSGKNLNERTSYARVVFKNNLFCVSNCKDFFTTPQIIFHIGHGQLIKPAILTSKNFADVKLPANFAQVDPTLQFYFEFPNLKVWLRDDQCLMSNSGRTVSTSKCIPGNGTDAYTSLIDDIFNGKNENFVGSEHLVGLWRIWDDVLKNSAETKPRIYKAEDPESVLNFEITATDLKFIIKDKSEVVMETDFSPTTFLGQKLVTTDTDKLVMLLAQDIVRTIQNSKNNSKNFHIAFSGGKTPIRLFKILAEYFPKDVGDFVHFWQVDERCVSHDSEDSNFNQIWNNLIMSKYRHFSIRYDNIHPIPVSVNGRICDMSDGVHKMYEKTIRYHIPDLKFDYVILGVGSDGHTASLFPGNSDSSLTALVKMTEKSPADQRVTLTFSLINLAKQISVLVTGKEKQKILNSLEDFEHNSDYPILKVSPQNGQMTWFISSDAYPKPLH